MKIIDKKITYFRINADNNNLENINHVIGLLRELDHKMTEANITSVVDDSGDTLQIYDVRSALEVLLQIGSTTTLIETVDY